MYLFIFNGIYAVIAETKEEAKRKLSSSWQLDPQHGWYLNEDAEDPNEQGHLVVTRKSIMDGVIVL